MPKPGIKETLGTLLNRLSDRIYFQRKIKAAMAIANLI